jgi:hypothetical protein
VFVLQCEFDGAASKTDIVIQIKTLHQVASSFPKLLVQPVLLDLKQVALSIFLWENLGALSDQNLDSSLVATCRCYDQGCEVGPSDFEVYVSAELYHLLDHLEVVKHC